MNRRAPTDGDLIWAFLAGMGLALMASVMWINLTGG
jgi:hypothetical protein